MAWRQDGAAAAPTPNPPSQAEPAYDKNAWTPDEPSEPSAQADRRNARGKLAAGWRGLKSAIRGDSSFFGTRLSRNVHRHHRCHAARRSARWRPYRPGCVPGADRRACPQARPTSACAVGDPEEPRLKTAREIAAAGVLVAAIGSAAVTLTVLSLKFVELFAVTS